MEPAWTGLREVAGTVRSGVGHFGHRGSLISVKLGLVLHKYPGSYYNVIREKSNVAGPIF
jgi:hypothetical protein